MPPWNKAVFLSQMSQPNHAIKNQTAVQKKGAGRLHFCANSLQNWPLQTIIRKEEPTVEPNGGKAQQSEWTPRGWGASIHGRCPLGAVCPFAFFPHRLSLGQLPLLRNLRMQVQEDQRPVLVFMGCPEVNWHYGRISEEPSSSSRRGFAECLIRL